MTLNEAAAIRAGDVLTIPQLIRMHGDVTDKVARLRHTLDALRITRALITEEEGEGELILAEAIREYERMQNAIAASLGWA